MLQSNGSDKMSETAVEFQLVKIDKKLTNILFSF